MIELIHSNKQKGAVSILYLGITAIIYVVIIEFILETSYAISNKAIMENAARIAVREAARNFSDVTAESVRAIALNAAASVVPALQKDAIVVEPEDLTSVTPGGYITVKISQAYQPRFLPEQIFPDQFQKKIVLKVASTMKAN